MKLYNEEDRAKLIEWYKKELESDMHNYNEFIRMQKNHLRKSQINNFGKEISKSKKEISKKLNIINSNKVIFMSTIARKEHIQ